MAELGFQLFDADNHMYEPRDSFTRFIEPRYADRAVRAVAEGSHEQLYVDGRPCHFLDGHGTLYDLVGRPGSLKEMLRKLKAGQVDEAYQWEPVRPEYRDRDARLAQMDAQGVEACLLFGSISLVVELAFSEPEPLYANLHAFNRWLDEDWGFAYRDRIFAPPWLSLRDLDLAVNELDWVLSRGARVIGMRPGAAYGRSPADPYFDPFWARLDEAHGSVAFHLTDAGYNREVSVLWGERPEPTNLEMSAWQWLNCYGDRPIMDTLSSLVYFNFFSRFPHITAASVENGAGWVPYLVPLMDKMRGMARNGYWPCGQLAERPSEVFRRHVVVTPYPEDDVLGIIDAVGPESIVLGSDFPHPEGFVEPADFAHSLASLPSDLQRLILRDNGRRLVTA